MIASYVSFDTSVISALIRTPRNIVEEERHDKALYVFNEVANDGSQVIMPSIVYSEILSTLDDEGKSALEEISQHWIIAPFNTLSARICSGKFQSLKIAKRRQEDYLRNVFRVDTLILATALSSQTTRMYVADGHFVGLRDVVESEIEVISLDEVVIKTEPEQQELDFPS